MIYISYGTKDTPYEHIIEGYLKQSLIQFDLKYHVEYPEDMGSWQKNTHYKAEFIYNCLNKFKESVVFLDSDATVLQHPHLFSFIDTQDIDIALHYLDWKKNWRNEDGDVFEALSGTLYLNYNEKTLKFLRDWIAKNNDSMEWEQKNMQSVLEASNLVIEKLPYSYCTVINHQNKVPSHMIKEEDVVILHHQKSRQYKNFKRKNPRS